MVDQVHNNALHGTNMKQKILVVRDYCTRIKGSTCNRCELACPKDAISFINEGLPQINTNTCSECGICFGICDAFSSTQVTMLDLQRRIKRIALQEEGVYLTCEENIFPGLEVSSSVVVLPCLASLSPEFWAVILGDDIPLTIAVDFNYCNDCERAGSLAETLYAHAIETAQEWTGKTIGFTQVIPEKDILLNELTNPEDVDRRSAFTGLIGDVSDIATGKHRLKNSSVLQQFHEQRERSRAQARLSIKDIDELNAFAPCGHTKKTMMPKRQLLLEVINHNPTIAAKVPVFVTQIDKTICTNELRCSKVCPTGALSPDPKTGTITQTLQYCIGCGICVDACPHHALTLFNTTADIFVQKSQNSLEE